MSLSRQEIICCPDCGNEQEFTVWNSINVSKDPELKDSLLDGNLTSFICTKCGESSHVAYDILYHDMGEELAIWLKYPDENGTFEIENQAKNMFSVISDTYICRLVPSFQELIEKIRIFDDGYDDYFIELLKLLICIKQGIDITHPFYYFKKERRFFKTKEMVFVLPNEEVIEMRYPMKKETEKSFTPILAEIIAITMKEEESWPYVNREYIMDKLVESGLIRVLFQFQPP